MSYIFFSRRGAARRCIRLLVFRVGSFGGMSGCTFVTMMGFPLATVIFATAVAAVCVDKRGETQALSSWEEDAVCWKVDLIGNTGVWSDSEKGRQLFWRQPNEWVLLDGRGSRWCVNCRLVGVKGDRFWLKLHVKVIRHSSWIADL